MTRWKSKTPTDESGQKIKREAVLREAGRVIGKRGFHNTSLDDVARGLQVSKGTLYNYVRDKQEILREFQLASADIARRAFEAGEGRRGTGAQTLRTVLTTYIHLITEETGGSIALIELDAMRPEDRERAIKTRDMFQRRLLALVKSGISDGSLRDLEDPKLAVFTFMGAINWLPRWYSPDGQFSGKELAEMMADLLLNGLVSESE